MIGAKPSESAGQVAAALWTTDRDLQITSAHGAVLAERGRSGEEFVGQSIFEVFQTNDLSVEPIAAHRRAVAGEPATFAIEALGHSWDCQVQPLRDADGAVVGTVGIAFDATHRRLADEELQRSRLRYEDLVNTLDGIVWEADAATVRFTFVSPQVERILGYSVERWLAEPTFWQDHMHPDDRVWAMPFCARATAEMRPHQFEYRMVAADGRIVWLRDIVTVVVEHGQPAKLRGVMVDITEKKQAEQLLEQRVAERTRELRALLEISENVASTLELKPLLEVILAQLKGLMDYSAAAILVVQGDELSVVGAQEPFANDFAEPFRWPVSAFGSFWDTLSRGVAIDFPDVHGDTPLAAEFRGVAGQWLESRRSFVRSCLWAPLVVKDRIIGLLGITHGDAHHFTSRDVELATAVARHVGIAIENARLFTEVQGKAVLEERQRLARELHDSVSQALYGIVLGTETARKLLDRDPPRAAAPLEYVHSLAEAGLAEMRALIFELRPESLETEGLVVALAKQADALRARHQLVIETDLGDEPTIPVYVKEALYRITQEALHNVVKHAEATRVSVRLAREVDQVVLEVCDDGIGFATNEEFPGHLGLRSMRERTTHLGGSIEMSSACGRGTTIRVRVPYREA